MSTRFQAQIKSTTAETLSRLQERLELNSSDKAALLDELTTLANWCIEQAARGHTIIATKNSDATIGEINLNPVLTRLRENSEVVRQPITHIDLSREEAENLYRLMSTPLPNDNVTKFIEQAANNTRQPPILSWGD